MSRFRSRELLGQFQPGRPPSDPLDRITTAIVLLIIWRLLTAC